MQLERRQFNPPKALMDFRSFNWTERDTPFRDAEKAGEYGEFSFEASGHEFFIEASREHHNAQGEELIRFYVSWNSQIAYKGYIHIYEEEGLKSDMGVAKLLRNTDDLKGVAVGRKLYASMRAYLQHRANALNKSICDIAERSEDYPEADGGLNSTQWNNVFQPILEAAGYTKLDEGVWQKDYHPQKNK